MAERLADKLSPFGSATLHEGLGQRGALDPVIKPLKASMRVAGRAYTVACPPGDNLMIHLGVARAAPGDVLVVDAGGVSEGGHFGDILGTAARARDLSGLVIDGTVRDCEALAELGLPVFARGLSIKACSKNRPGRIGAPIFCGGVAVATGDVVVGDRDGVVALPASDLDATIEAAATREDKEARIRERLWSGETTLDILGIRAEAEAGAKAT